MSGRTAKKLVTLIQITRPAAFATPRTAALGFHSNS
jgi:hypothetical protein